MGEFAAIAAIASAAVSTGTAIMGAQAAQNTARVQRQQAQVQAQQYAEQASQVREAASQDEANRLVALRRTLGAAAALRGARGLSGDSMGASILEDASRDAAARDLDTITLNSEREARMLGLSGSRALLSGEAAATESGNRAIAGYGQAATSAIQVANQGYKFLSGR